MCSNIMYSHIIHKWKLHCNLLAAPSRVSGVTLTKTVESQAPALRVTWTPPQSDLTISQYQVEYRRSGTTSWDNATALSVSFLVTSTLLTRLDAGTEYTVRVRAVSAVEHGNWSVEQTGRTFSREFNASSTLIDASTLVAHYGTNIYQLIAACQPLAWCSSTYITHMCLLQEIHYICTQSTLTCVKLW